MPEGSGQESDTAGISAWGNSLCGFEAAGMTVVRGYRGILERGEILVSAECTGIRSEKTVVPRCLAAITKGYAYDFGPVR